MADNPTISKPKNIDDLIPRVPEIMKELIYGVKGVNVGNYDNKTGSFRIVMPIPQQDPLHFFVDSQKWEANLVPSGVPETTPPSYLKVADILINWGYSVK